MVDVTPGDSGANKGYWRRQIRDRYGRWVEEGNLVSFLYQLPGVDMPTRGVGRFIENMVPGVAIIEVETDKGPLPKGTYQVNTEEADIYSVQAELPEEYVKNVLEKAEAEQRAAEKASKPDYYDEEIIDGDFFNMGLLRRRNPNRIYPNDTEVFQEDQLEALKWYAQQGHKFINRHLRGNEDTSDENKDYIFLIDEAIEENGEVFQDSTVFRGDMPMSDSPYLEFLENLEVGAVVSFPEFLSTSNDPSIAFNEFGPGVGSEISNNAQNEHNNSAFFWSIDIPEGSTAMGLPEGTGYQGDAESEVLLPRNSELEIMEIKKVPQTDPETGEENGNFNYFFQARVREKVGESFERSDYAGTHEAPGPFSDVSVQLLDIEQNMPKFGSTLPEAMKLYGTGNRAADEESIFQVLLAKNSNDPDYEVTVYRAVPEGATSINEGDWVSLSETYAQQHLDSTLLGKGQVISKKVKIKDLWTDGDSINEWGWDPRNPNDAEQKINL